MCVCCCCLSFGSEKAHRWQRAHNRLRKQLGEAAAARVAQRTITEECALLQRRCSAVERAAMRRVMLNWQVSHP